MKLRNKTIKIIAETISGDNGQSFYRSGPQLVDFFNEFGFDDLYEKGFPSRWVFADEKIRQILSVDKFIEFINFALDEEYYLEQNSIKYESQDSIVRFWNKYLALNNYEIIRRNNKFVLTDISTSQIIVNEVNLDILSTAFMNEQIAKCDEKISNKDYDGAITNARSLVEEVLLEIEERKCGHRGSNDGDINKIYNRVKKLINFDPSKKEFNESLKQILSGLNSIVTGLGKLRSKASDSHAREYKPSKHHAILAVNSAKTFTDFIISSYLYQEKQG